MPSLKLQDSVVIWPRGHDSKTAQHEATLHSIIAKMDEYTGGTKLERPESGG
jgi:hypothetical protein